MLIGWYCTFSGLIGKFFAFVDMTSTELKEALNRRLKKIDGGASNVVDAPQTDSSHLSDEQPDATGRLPDEKDVDKLFRSGWAAPATIPRSIVLPTPPPVIPIPLKADVLSKKVC